MTKSQRSTMHTLKWHKKNMPKYLAYMKKWRKANKHRYKGYDLKRTYGITIRQYDQMLASQGDSCAICKRHKSLFKRHMNVDHNHETGKIRALLCSNCNTLIGLAQENPETCIAASEYLKSHLTNGNNS